MVNLFRAAVSLLVMMSAWPLHAQQNLAALQPPPPQEIVHVQSMSPPPNAPNGASMAAQTPPTTTTAPATPAATSSSAATPQMGLAEFEHWLQTNGYAQPIESSSARQQNGPPANIPSPNKATTVQVVKSAPAGRPQQLVPPQGRLAPGAPPDISGRDRPPVIRNPPPPRPPLSFEEGQQIMINSAPPVTYPVSPDSLAAFNAMLQQNMPLTPQQIVQLRQQIDTSQRAAAVLPNIPPKPVSTTLMMNLAPGSTPPAVRLAQGYVSSLVFVDSTGSPWPIAAFDIGNPKAVNIQWDGKSNILLLQAVLPYSNGDIVIRLVGLPTPITLEIVSGQRVVDFRVDIHVPGIGPNTKELPVGIALPGNANQLLLGVLDGIAPPGSRPLRVVGADALAWIVGGKLYLRTRMTVLSPGWMGTMVSPDGMHAYELPRTSSVLVSRFGEPAEIRIEGL